MSATHLPARQHRRGAAVHAAEELSPPPTRLPWGSGLPLRHWRAQQGKIRQPATSCSQGAMEALLTLRERGSG